MHFLVFAATAALSYILSSVNPAIELSKAVYHKDIRSIGSGNPGYTNFRRSFGPKLAWLVFLMDIIKAAIVCCLAGWTYERLYGAWQLGVAISGLFAMLGHAYPIFYRFRGGKCILVGGTAVWLGDWRVGLISLIVLAVMLLAFRIMSLATMTAAVACPILAALLGTQSPAVLVITICGAALVLFRHRGNIKRLLSGTEPRFSFRD